MDNFTLTRWDKTDYEALTAHLLSRKDPAYKDFHQKLIPGVENFIGVRTPAVKALAKEIAKGDAESFLQVSRSDYYEQAMLEGLVIGAAKCSFDVFWERVFAFVPKIDNWAVNDSFCAAAKMVGKHLPESLPQVDKLLCSDNPWQVSSCFWTTMSGRNGSTRPFPGVLSPTPTSITSKWGLPGFCRCVT